jgi:hypothetical protein
LTHESGARRLVGLAATRRESLLALLQELEDADPMTAEARDRATKRAAQLRAAVEG